MEKFVHIADEGAMIVMGRYEQSTQEQSAYQSEAALEKSFIQKLVAQGYERLQINNEADLLANLRLQLENLNELKPFLDRLREAHGEVTCRQAIRMANRLKEELDDFVIKSGDEVLDNLGHRALVAAFRKGCLLYAANGMHWEKAIEGFCRWSLHYDLWLKLHFFSDLIRNADCKVKTSRRGPSNLLVQIKTDTNGVFTYQDAVNMRLANGKEEDGTAAMLNQWVSRGHIERLPDDHFRIIPKNDK